MKEETIAHVKCGVCNKDFTCHNNWCADVKGFICRCAICTSKACKSNKNDFKIIRRKGYFAFKGFCELFKTRKEMMKIYILESCLG